MDPDLAARVLNHPANTALFKHISRYDRHSGRPSDSGCSPEEVHQPYLNLGTHPDCVERIWKKLGGLLPDDCRWVVHDRPVMVHKNSGVVFGFATGTVYALRLAPPDFDLALALEYQQQHQFPRGVLFDVSEFGPTWVFGKYKKEEEDWVLRAFDFAAS